MHLLWDLIALCQTARCTGWLSEVYIPGSGIKVPGSIQAPGVYSAAFSTDFHRNL